MQKKSSREGDGVSEGEVGGGRGGVGSEGVHGVGWDRRLSCSGGGVGGMNSNLLFYENAKKKSAGV